MTNPLKILKKFKALQTFKKTIITGLITAGATAVTYLIKYILSTFGIEGDMSIGTAIDTILNNIDIIGSNATVAMIVKWIVDWLKHRTKETNLTETP